MHSSQPYPLSPPFFFSHVLFQLSNYYPYLLLFLLYHFFAHFLVRFSSLCIFPLPFAFPFINFSTSINFFLPFNPINLVISLSLLKMFPTILFFYGKNLCLFEYLHIFVSIPLPNNIILFSISIPICTLLPSTIFEPYPLNSIHLLWNSFPTFPYLPSLYIFLISPLTFKHFILS